MRIAYVCTDQGIPVFGRKGCSIHVQEVVRAMLALGNEVHVFTPRDEGTVPFALQSVRIHHLPLAAQKNASFRERASFKANHVVRVLLECEGPFDLVYERYALWSHAAIDYARSMSIPGLLEVNAPLIEEQARHRVLVDLGTAEWVAHRVFGNASALIAVSEGVASYLKDFPDTEGRIHVIPNGVDPDRFPDVLVPSMPGAPGTFTIGFVGTLKAWHGLPIVVEAFEKVHAGAPGTRLLIVGDGPEGLRVEEDLSRRGLLHAAHFTGEVDPGEVPGLIMSMDVALAPYPDVAHSYFSPLKIYEYMAAGRAVVASRIGQLSEVIEDGVTGLLSAPGDFAGLAASIDRLRGDPALRARLGRAARAKIRRDHTWKTTVSRSLDLAKPLDPVATAGSRLEYEVAR